MGRESMGLGCRVQAGDALTTATHNCCAEGCTRPIAKSLLMCMTHWRMVPAPLQREVYRAFRAWDRAPLGEALPHRKAYRKAAREAVTAVREKEIKRQVRREAGGDLLDFNQER